MHEFNLIDEYFNWQHPPDDVVIAVGDDAAVLDIPANQQLVTSIDTLISGVHFPENTLASHIGHKSLAVNLSDIAAMGATPKWFTLALSLPRIDISWLKDFSSGLKKLALDANCFLVGGDTTRGPLSISIQVMGVVEKGQALLRSGAQAGDKIYVTGTLGDAAAGLLAIQQGLKLSEEDAGFLQKCLNTPTPRLFESTVIKAFASSCIDVSDGLLQDLDHLLMSSGVGAKVDLASLPLSASLQSIEPELARKLALNGGDDYELLFTIPANKETDFLNEIGDRVSCIGSIHSSKEELVDQNGNPLLSSGYNHFDDK